MASKLIIVVKKKGGHSGHHGGAWKVAYADFVTAMMSLFIVLWLMNSSEKVRQAVAGYFNDPRGTAKQTGSDQSGTSDNLALTENNIAGLKKKIEESIRKMNDLQALQNQIQITITPEGLRIELLETKDGTFFDTGSAALNQHGRELLVMLAGQLGGVPNRLSIEGHTDAQPYASKEGYGNWELSADRANAARRVMQTSGLRNDQVSQVRGYADQKLRVPDNPMDPSNRRISLIVQYLTVAPPAPPSKAKAEPASHGAEETAKTKNPSQPGTGSASAAPATTGNPAPAGSAAGSPPTSPRPIGAASSNGSSAKPSAAKPAVSRSAGSSLIAKLLAKLPTK